MIQSPRWWILCCSIVVALACVLTAPASGAAPRPPNFLFILGDNLGKDWFHCYGSDERCTPNIDKLASGGVRFAHCYMTALCSTSRAALLTGRYGFRTGWHTHHDAAIYGGRELEGRYWDPVVFKNGQRLELSGRFGPDVYLEYLVGFIQRHRDRPFLAYYATPLTHIPVVTTPASPDKEASEREQFVGMVRYLDQQVGALVSELERLGLRDETIIVFTTDNGSARRISGSVGGKLVPGGLGTQTEPGLDVPLIVNCPGRVPQGRVSKALVDCTDFFPTLIELAGAEPPVGVVLDGCSFAAAISGSGDGPPAREWIFASYATTRVVRDQRYKLYSTGAFYDLTADWLETTNLADSRAAEIAAARQRLQRVLDQLPADTQLPFAPRSQSAFKLRGRPE